MRGHLFYLLFVTVLLAGCSSETESEYEKRPAMAVEVDRVANVYVTLNIEAYHIETLHYIVRHADDSAVPSSSEILQKGEVSEVSSQLTITGLQPETSYKAYFVGSGHGRTTQVNICEFTTVDLYEWEEERKEIPTFADLDLLPGGLLNKQPNTWDEQRFLPHVTYKDEDEAENWLHEAFLLICGQDDVRGTMLSITPDGKSANKDSWLDFIAYWFDKGKALDILDKTVGNAISRIGQPAFRHNIVVTMPDPIIREYFGDKSSSTRYWGQIDGRVLDFQDVNDQILAYKWFIDQVRIAWQTLAPKHLQLAGFYILSEELVMPKGSHSDYIGWNYDSKRWDKILPHVSSYLHSFACGLYWIPYYKADGYYMSKQLGVDITYIQPNKYWDYNESKSWSWVFNTMSTYGHGMELEFEGTHGESGWSGYVEGVKRTSASILEQVYTTYEAEGRKPGQQNPYAERNKQLFRDYMNRFKEAGYYGKAYVATYSGTNAMVELATSSDPKDREMYLEYCKFITESPLRKK